MYTRVAPEKKPDQTYGGISASKKKPPAPVKSARRPNVRSKDYRMLVYLISNNPDYITQDEYALLQRTIGNQATIKLIHEAKERKRLKKLGQTPMSGNAKPVRNSNNEINKKTNKEIHQEENKETNNKTMQLRSQGKNPGTKSDTSDKKNGQANQGRLSTTKSRLPEALRNKLEEMSGISLSDVKVHENSDKPQQLGAHAFTQGNEIHLAPGQEEHLPHEGWHAVQQKQGRVLPTFQMKPNEALNDDHQLEKEADIMGQKAAKEYFISEIQIKENPREVSNQHNDRVIQKKADKNNRKIRLYEPKSGAVAEVDAQNTQTIDLLLSEGYKNSSTKGEKENWVLKAGHRNINDDVVVLQKFLVSCRYLIMPISSSTNKRVPFGTYGELTKQAVIKFQEKKGLKSDGIVGPDTWKAALLPWNKESNEPDRHNHQYLIILSNKSILHDEKKDDKNTKGDIDSFANIKSNLYILGYHNVYKDYKAARNQFLKEFFDKGHSLHADFIRMGKEEHYSSLLAWTDRALAGKITRNKKESQGTGNNKSVANSFKDGFINFFTSQFESIKGKVEYAIRDPIGATIDNISELLIPYPLMMSMKMIDNTKTNIEVLITGDWNKIAERMGNNLGEITEEGILALISAGVVKIVKAPNGTVKTGTLSNVEVRTWYLEQESKIPGMINKNLSLEQQAKQAVDLRNQFRTQARDLMADRDLAASLNKSDPNLTWDQVVQKYSDKGFKGDALYQEIINATQRSRTSVNESLGIKK